MQSHVFLRTIVLCHLFLKLLINSFPLPIKELIRNFYLDKMIIKQFQNSAHTHPTNNKGKDEITGLNKLKHNHAVTAARWQKTLSFVSPLGHNNLAAIHGQKHIWESSGIQISEKAGPGQDGRLIDQGPGWRPRNRADPCWVPLQSVQHWSCHQCPLPRTQLGRVLCPCASVNRPSNLCPWFQAPRHPGTWPQLLSVMVQKQDCPHRDNMEDTTPILLRQARPTSPDYMS